MPRTMLNDELWANLYTILRQNGLYAKQSTRLSIEGILYRMRTGCPWRDPPYSASTTPSTAPLTAGLQGVFLS